ncbi:MAG: response regulator transcription factor [Sulfurospirillaceae bacterium]|nr:response regulator transcription factor [Sulfurospirillaceae bacterium]
MTILYSSKAEVLKHWSGAFSGKNVAVCEDENSFYDVLEQSGEDAIVLMEKRQYPNIEEFLSLLQKDFPSVKIMLFSNKPSFEEGYGLLKFGIKTYANTYMSHTHLKDAFEAVTNGNVWLYPEFIQIMICAFSSSSNIPQNNCTDLLKKLSEREIQIALLLKKGLSNKEIALRTGISERTVKAHLSSIFEKTGIKDRLSLALHL